MAASAAGAWESKGTSAPIVCQRGGPDSEKQLEAAQDPTVNDPPNGGYGWIMVISILLLNAATWGQSFLLMSDGALANTHKDSTLLSACTCHTSKQTIRFRAPRLSSTLLSAAHLLLLLCFVHLWRTS